MCRKLVSVLLSHTFYGRLPSNFVCELVFKRSDLGLKMDTFLQISTELLPLICVENWFPRSIMAFFGLLSSNFVYGLIFVREVV